MCSISYVNTAVKHDFFVKVLQLFCRFNFSLLGIIFSCYVFFCLFYFEFSIHVCFTAKILKLIYFCFFDCVDAIVDLCLASDRSHCCDLYYICL